MADGLTALLQGHDTYEAEAAIRNIADLVIFAHQYAEKMREQK